jgi:hypothetical protein
MLVMPLLKSLTANHWFHCMCGALAMFVSSDWLTFALSPIVMILMPDCCSALACATVTAALSEGPSVTSTMIP